MKKNICAIMGTVMIMGTLQAFELGKTDMEIFHVRENARAAAELGDYLNRVYGRKYTLRKFTEGDRTKPGIFVGVRPEGVKIEVDEKKEFCGRHVTDTQLYLFGNKPATKLQGTNFSVYEFLERECGVRWLWPGDLGTVAEPQKPKQIKNGTEIVTPFFVRRMSASFHYGYPTLQPEDLKALIEWQAHRKLGSSFHGSMSHAFQSLMPRQKYGKEHPEYYSLVSPGQWIGDPKPDKPTRRNDWTRRGPWQLCTSNKDVRRIISEKIAADKTGFARSISPNDGFGFCECPECLKQDGKPRPPREYGVKDLTNRMYDFAEDIANQVHKLNPKANVGMFAYSFFDGVPDKKIHFPGNMYLSFCYMVSFMSEEEQQELEQRTIGLAATGARIFGREYWGTHYTMNYPLSHSRKIDRNMKLLYRCGAGGIGGEPGAAFAPRATDLYILTKLSWDPTLKREDILHDFCDSAFGPKAGPVMYEMFEKIEDWTEKTTNHFADHRGPNYKYYDNLYAARNRAMADCYNDAFQKMCEGYLSRAMKLAETPERRARIAYIRRGTRYAAITTAWLNACADLAAIGINMSLTQPSGKEIRMEKKNLIAVVQNAIKVAKARIRYVQQNGNQNALSKGYIMEGLGRPWKIYAEKAALDLSANRFNYLVNGAFEYSGYSWKMTGAKGAQLTTTRKCNHDADDNYMVQRHAGQGISLQVDLPAGSSAELVNARKVCPDEPQKVNLKMFVKCDDDPLKYMTVKFGPVVLQGITLPADAEDGSGWREVRFKQAAIPAGEHTFQIQFKNTGSGKITLNLDDLVLRMKEANR